jgi:hypothetical protein
MQCRRNARACWAVFRGPSSTGAHANLCMLCTACFFLIKNADFVGSANTYMFNFIDIYSFIPVSVCVGRDPQCTVLTGGL